MLKAAKVIVAGALSWAIAMVTASAAFGWHEWSAEYDSDERFVFLCVLPPLAVLAILALFRWALGKGFMARLAGRRDLLAVAAFVALAGLGVASFSGSLAATKHAKTAAYAADEAQRSAEQASEEAGRAAQNAEEAASACRTR